MYFGLLLVYSTRNILIPSSQEKYNSSLKGFKEGIFLDLDYSQVHLCSTNKNRKACYVFLFCM